MSLHDPTLYLHDMLGAAQTARRYSLGRTREDFDTDGMLCDAVIRQLEILGEAAARVDTPTRESHPEVPWSDLVGMRNVLIHAYHRVDRDIVWVAVTVELPALILLLEALVGVASAAGD